jgi:hypothetical protein
MITGLVACRSDKGSPEDTGTGVVDSLLDADGDGYDTDSDCDDANSLVSPAAEETCDGVDNDCDGAVDEDVTSTFYKDDDKDGFGDEDRTTAACSEPDGYVGTGNDCDDRDPDTYPGAAERCDGVDNDCDKAVDEDVLETWYADADGDGYGALESAYEVCDPPPGYVDNSEDCDDTDWSAFPGGEEVCDEADNDCDGDVDEDVTTTYHQDTDGDGYGIIDATTEACSVPTGYAVRTGDCDDAAAAISPNATELCDGTDNDCDGDTDEDDAADAETWHADGDSDGYGDRKRSTAACVQPSGYVENSEDCDDGDKDRSPAVAEVCDSKDNDCDSAVDEGVTTAWYADGDGDGYGDQDDTVEACAEPSGYVSDDTDCDDGSGSVSPAATEVCNDIDDDCDSLIDDDDPDTADGTTWYLDYDSDGFGGSRYTVAACEQPSGFTAAPTDCDDTDGAINPDAAEVCNGEDDDCDGDIDSEDSDGPATADWYPDSDGDGFGDRDATPASSCAAPEGYVEDGTDCDDTDGGAYPGAAEICDSKDNSCDGTIDNDDELLGEDGACPGLDCADILAARSDADDGSYWIDPDGDGSIEVLCDMSTDGGGWTLIASFNNDDGTYSWTKYGYNTDNLDNWTNEASFGDLDDRETEDYKSPAFWRVEATDLLAMDSNSGWAAYEDSLSGSLADTLGGYSTCQDTTLSGVSVYSSNGTLSTYGQIAFYGSDPNYYDSCAQGYYTDGTDSSVVALAGTGCGSAGFGHLGYLSSAGHEDRDFKFCLGSTLSLSSAYSCGTWEGVNMIAWFDETYCDYAMLYVR